MATCPCVGDFVYSIHCLKEKDYELGCIGSGGRIIRSYSGISNAGLSDAGLSDVQVRQNSRALDLQNKFSAAQIMQA